MDFAIKLIVAFLVGFAPVFIWLWFWDHEDKHPEPKKLVILAFIGGIVSVLFALLFENYACIYLAQGINGCNVPVEPTPIIVVWAIIEELLKFIAAYVFVLRRTENHEPIDSMMYMITVALGFSAMENALFIFWLAPTSVSYGIQAIIVGNMRFVGATLLHTMASSMVGFAMALSFYKSKVVKRIYLFIGLVTAVILHIFFNLSIIHYEGSRPLIPLFGVWISVVAILLVFEKVKRII